MHFTLERYKSFKYVAWTLFIGFAFFVGSLAMKLSAVAANIEANTTRTTNALYEYDAAKKSEATDPELERN